MEQPPQNPRRIGTEPFHTAFHYSGTDGVRPGSHTYMREGRLSERLEDIRAICIARTCLEPNRGPAVGLRRSVEQTNIWVGDVWVEGELRPRIRRWG
jgi:hypothetical protein